MPDKQTYRYEVAMTCEGCANAVRRVIGKLGDQAELVSVDVGSKTVVIASSSLSQDELLETLKKTGKAVKAL